MNAEKPEPPTAPGKPASAKNFIRTEQLRYSYKKDPPEWKLNNMDLAIPENEYLLIAGPSGSGKSTLCRTFNGLIPHFYGGLLKGRVWVGGRNTAEWTVGDLFSRVGMVFQNPEAQLFNRTVENELAFGLESLGIPRQEMKRRVPNTAQDMGIAHLLNRDPHSLSGGEQQLVSIAAMLCLEPTVLVLDEPYANLDPAHVGRVRKALRRIHDRGIGVMIAEHRMNYTAPDAGRMILVENGRVKGDGPPSFLLTPKNANRFGLTLGWKAESPRTADRPLPENSKERNEPPVLTVEDIAYKIGGRRVLDRIRFEVHRGESVAVLGANGAGKTTLLKHLNGLLRPAKGRIRLHGDSIRNRKVSQLASHVGMAFQNPAGQFFKLTVQEEILAGPLAMDRLDEAWIEEIIRLFGLGPLLNRPPFRLSGGEKKRVAFAAALAAKPDILVMDEPTAGQDGHFRSTLGGLLSEIRSRGRTVIFATHDLAFAAENSHRWLVLHKGRIVRNESPKNILADIRFLENVGLHETLGK
ncbi:MAG: ABC transporter ATP-binding protein [Desulfococcaceae bacterium]